MEKLRPNDQRAKNAISFIWLVLALQLIMSVSHYFQFNLLQKAIDGEQISQQAATFNDLRQQILAIIYIIAYIVSGIMFIMWFRRAYFNLHLKRSKYLSYSEGWAAGSWFVPFINLYRPYQIMKEIYEETNKLLKYNSDKDTQVETDYLGWWWGIWITVGIAGNIISRLSRNAVNLNELSTYTLLNMIIILIGVLLSIITIKVIKDYAVVEPLILEIKDNQVEEVTTETNNQ